MDTLEAPVSDGPMQGTATIDTNLERASVPVAELLSMVADYNPRRIRRDAKERLRQSLRSFGVVQPVVVNTRSNRIVGGHQRIRIAAEEGVEAMPVIYVDLPEDREQELNLVLNSKEAQGEWDNHKLAELLTNVQARGHAAIERSGFSADTVSKVVLQAQARAAEVARLARTRRKNHTDDQQTVDQTHEVVGGTNEASAVSFAVSMTAAQREIVYEALANAKSTHNINHSGKALYLICKEILDNA